MSLEYSFYVDILTRNQTLKGRLTEAIEGSLTYNQASTSHAGGVIRAETTPGQTININLQQDRVRVYFNDTGTTTLMGTYLIAGPDVQYDRGDGGARQKFNFVLLDKISILNEFKFPYSYTVRKGVNSVTAVRNIIKTATGEGDTSIVFTPSTKVLRESRIWDVGTSALQIINDLLAAIDYWSVRCDPSGRFLVQPYVSPRGRPVVHTFSDRPDSIHMDDWSRTREIATVPNRFTVYSTGTEEVKGYVGVSTNTDPNSPFSYQARGRWIDEVESVTEFATQEDATLYAARRLRDVSDPISTITMRHAFKPMELHSRARLQWEDIDLTGTVYTMSINLGKPDLMTTSFREIL